MIHLHKLGRKYLDFEFPVKNEARLRIVERPGLWMGRAALDQLLADMRQVVNAVLPSGLVYGVLSGDKRGSTTPSFRSSTTRRAASPSPSTPTRFSMSKFAGTASTSCTSG